MEEHVQTDFLTFCLLRSAFSMIQCSTKTFRDVVFAGSR